LIQPTKGTNEIIKTGNPYLKGRLSTINLLQLQLPRPPWTWRDPRRPGWGMLSPTSV